MIGEGRVDGEVIARRDPRARASAQREVPFESRFDAAVHAAAGDAIAEPLYDVVAVLLAHVIAVDAKTMKE